jgi:hypothetical protein
MSSSDTESNIDIEEHLEFLTAELEKKEKDYETLRLTLMAYEKGVGKLQVVLSERDNQVQELRSQLDDKDVELALLRVERDDNDQLTNERVQEDARAHLKGLFEQLRTTDDQKTQEIATLKTQLDGKDAENTLLQEKLERKISSNQQVRELTDEIESKNIYISKLESVNNKNRIELMSTQRVTQQLKKLKAWVGVEKLEECGMRPDDPSDDDDAAQKEQINNLTNQLQEKTAQLNISLKNLNLKEEEILHYKSIMDKQHAHEMALNAQLTELKEQIGAPLSSSVSLDDTISKYEDRIAALETEHSCKLSDVVKDHTEKVNAATLRCEKLQHDLLNASQKRDELLNKVEEKLKANDTLEKQSKYVLVLEEQVNTLKSDNFKLKKLERDFAALKQSASEQTLQAELKAHLETIGRLEDECNQHKVENHKLQQKHIDYDMMKGTHQNKQNQLQELQKQVDDFKNGNMWFEKEQQINILQVQLQGKINVIETMNKNKSYVHNLEHKLSVMEKDYALLKTALDAKDKLIDEQLRMLNSRRR